MRSQFYCFLIYFLFKQFGEEEQGQLSLCIRVISIAFDIEIPPEFGAVLTVEKVDFFIQSQHNVTKKYENIKLKANTFDEYLGTCCHLQLKRKFANQVEAVNLRLPPKYLKKVFAAANNTMAPDSVRSKITIQNS